MQAYSRPIRSIAIVTNQAYSLTNFRGPLIEALVASGMQVHAFAPDYDEASRAAVRALGAEPADFPMQRTGMNPRGDLVSLFALTRAFRDHHFDLVLSYFIKPVIYGSLAARLARIPHRYALVAGLGYAFTDDGERSSWRRKAARRMASGLLRLGLGSCRRVFFQNADDIADLAKVGAVDRSRAVQLNGTGVDLTKFSVAPSITDPLTFLLTARLVREKGIFEYVEAARLVRARAPNTRFILLGGVDANPHSLTREVVEAWVDEGIIEWPGHVTDVKPWIEATSVFVLPSYYREGVPRSTQEAMAIGRAVITTDSTGCRETVIDGKTGFLVPVRDPGALADAMLRFVDDPGLVERMGLESRKLAEARFDVHAINRKMLDVMEIRPV